MIDDGMDQLYSSAIFCSMDIKSYFHLHGFSIVQEKDFRANTGAYFHFFYLDNHLYFHPSI